MPVGWLLVLHGWVLHYWVLPVCVQPVNIQNCLYRKNCLNVKNRLYRRKDRAHRLTSASLAGGAAKDFLLSSAKFP